MRDTLKISASTAVMLFAVLFFNGCNSTPEKYESQVYTVTISDMKFQPAELSVHQGDTVLWVNQDMVVHDVTEEKNKLWSSGQLPSGKSWKLPVERSADYFCSIHVLMKGKLVVK